MATFMLLLKGGDFSSYSPEDAQKILQDYMGWSQKLRTQGKYKGGDELKEGGRVVSVADGRVVDGPFTETKEVIGGFAVLEAPSLKEAIGPVPSKIEFATHNFGGRSDVLQRGNGRRRRNSRRRRHSRRR